MLTAEQIEERLAGLGGSDAPIIVGAATWRTPLELWLEKRGEIPSPDLSDNMRVKSGSWFEEPIRRIWMELNGKRCVKPHKAVWSPNHPFMLGHPDFLVTGEPWIGEIKNVGLDQAYKWGEDGSEQIPLHVFIQAQHNIECASSKTRQIQGCYVVAHFGGNEQRSYMIPRDQGVIDKLAGRLGEFWQAVQSGVPPNPVSAADAALLYPRPTEPQVAIDAECRAKLDKLKTVSQDITALTKVKKLLEGQITGFIGDAAQLVDAEGKPLATWKSQQRRSIDSARLKAEAPEIAEEYERVSEFRVLRIKK